MRQFTLAAGLAAGLCAFAAFGTAPALAANETDVATITCKSFMDSGKDEIGTVMIWLHGFFSGKADDTTFNMDDFGKSAEQMGAYCAQHPDVSVISAAKTVFGG